MSKYQPKNKRESAGMTETREQVFTCEGCSKPIFDGDRYHVGTDVELCEECAPSYQDLVSTPDYFRGVMDDKPLLKAGAQEMFDKHIAAGGKPEDKIVSA